MRPLTARRGRYHAKSGGANTRIGEHFPAEGTFRATAAPRRLWRRSCGRSACSTQFGATGRRRLALAGSGAPFGGEQIDGRVGRQASTAHNVTAAADYRTALLSDSPYAAVRYAPPVSGDCRFVARRPSDANEGPATFRSRARGTNPYRFSSVFDDHAVFRHTQTAARDL